jgi:hypothetical protein
LQDLQSSHENSFSSYFSLKIFKERRELSIKNDESEKLWTITFQQQKTTILFFMSLSLRGSFYKDDFESLIMPEKIDLASKSLKVDLDSKSFFLNIKGYFRVVSEACMFNI